jgi:hypothetical protein
MPDVELSSGGDAAVCVELQPALRQGRALTAAESAHIEQCENCLDAWLDATVTQTLDTKPEVRIPDDFSARVAENLPEKRSAARGARGPARHWGLLTAIVLVAVGMVAAAVADPRGVNTRLGMIVMALVVAEIAGIALWLGVGRTGGVGH